MVHMDKPSVCIRWSLFVANGFVWLGGSVMLGLAIWVTTEDTEYNHLAGNLHVIIAYIVLSSFIFIIGLIGACGILLMRKTILQWYFGLVMLLVLAELGIAVYLYLEKNKIKDHIHANWNKTSDDTRVVIQDKFECCSLDPVILEHGSSHDKSCFKDKDAEKERLKDCYTQLMDWLKTNQAILASFAIAVAVLEIFILGGTCRMVTKIESGDRFVRQIRVEPIQDQTNLPGQVTDPQHQTANKDGNLHNSKWSTIQRQNWAKRDPKYTSVFTLVGQ